MHRPRWYKSTGAVLALFVFSACSLVNRDFGDPRIWPYRLEKVLELSLGKRYPVDLDRDGRDELLQLQASSEGKGPGYESFLILSHDLQIVEQVNFSGRLLPFHFLDMDEDGLPEIVAPWVRNDSLFVTFVSRSGVKRHTLWVTRGQPRIEDGGVFQPWLPNCIAFYLEDLDGDGQREFISVVQTGWARRPRGVFVHTFPEGRLLGQKLVGAALRSALKGDYDHDGKSEIVVSTTSPRNFARAGGFDDEHSYLIVFELNPEPTIEWWKEVGGLWSRSHLFYADFNRDGKKEFLSYVYTESAQPEKVTFELLEPGTWRTLRQKSVAEPFTSAPVLVDLDHDAVPEILTVRVSGDSGEEIWVFNGDLELVERRKFDFDFMYLISLPDVDGDGVDEIIVQAPNGRFWLGPDLEVRLMTDEPALGGVFQRGLGNPPYFYGAEGTGVEARTVFWRVERNRFYLWYRYLKLFWAALGLAVVAAAVIGTVWRRRQRGVLQVGQSVALDTDPRGILLVNPAGRVLLANATARAWFALPDTKYLRKLALEAALPQKELQSFFARLHLRPPHRHEQEVTLHLSAQVRPFRVTAEPIWQPRGHAPHWLVVFEDLTSVDELYQARTWSAMAQRIAHDIKNPLTSIQLTLQRLQMEYRDRDPKSAADYDGYTSRILERIEALRRMSHGFMKLLSLEQLHREPTDLNAFLRELFDQQKLALPDDIELGLDLASDLPEIPADREQLQTLVENLVSNAVEAMPDGGRLTLRTSLVVGLQLHSLRTAPQDYAVLEVTDTGIGIPVEKLPKLFQPFQSGRKSGTGLGLAIVKKIAEDHGGHVEVSSEPGVGTSFVVYLPMVAEGDGADG